MKRFVRALRRAAEVLDVPGAPRTLRLDHVQVDGASMAIDWSFVDPEVPPSRESRGGRVRGTLTVRPPARGSADEAAQGWWSQAQLEAARRYKQKIDADWVPGEPFTRRTWTVEQAWEALLTHLGAYGAEVRVDGGEIRVTHVDERTVYNIDPKAWATYLNRHEGPDPPRNPEVVPAATPLVDGLPLWVIDELTEVAGAWGSVVALVEGRLMGLGQG